MKQSIIVILLALSVVAAGCAQQSEVDELERRIDELESDLETATAVLDASEDTFESAIEAIETETEEATESIQATSVAGVAKVDSAADEAADNLLAIASDAASANIAIRDVRGDLDGTQAELLETRIWVGNLAACLIYEADLGRYDFWTATRTGGPLSFGNRGEWGAGPLSFIDQEQMSHCER